MLFSVLFIILLFYAIAMLFVKGFSFVFYYVVIAFKFMRSLVGVLLVGLIMFILSLFG